MEDDEGTSGRCLLRQRIRPGHPPSRAWTPVHRAPGGGIEHGKDPATAAVRELAEETGLSGTVVRHLTTGAHPDRTAHYFLLNVTPSGLAIGDPEAELQSAENHYSPSWIPVAQLATEPIVPDEVRAIIRDAARTAVAAQPAVTQVAPPRQR